MLTFEQAKLRVNPDPNWQPARGSAEYLEIIALMRQSGSTFLDHLSTPKPPLTAKDVYVNNSYVNPIVNPKMLPAKKAISKSEFLSLPSNRKAFSEALLSKIVKVLPPQITVTRAMLDELKTAVAANLPKGTPQPKLSKQEFMNMADNREYMRLHSILNK